MIRKNINIPEWQDDILKFISNKYNGVSTSQLIRLAIAYYIFVVGEANGIKSDISFDEAVNMTKKIKESGKANFEYYDSVLFAARKIAEIRMKKIP